jgi:acetolactate synthase-1/3 small subunit
MKLHTISLLVNNHPGVLQRVAGLFGRRGFNIESITVGQSEEPGLSRMTIETSGDNRTLYQVKKQLNKLIDVGLENLIVQATGDRIKIAKMIGLFVPYGILEIGRTGVTAMARSDTFSS